MFKNEKLAAYGCIKNTARSTKKATCFYVAILTVLHVLLLYYPNLFAHFAPSFPDDLKPVPLGWRIGAIAGFAVLFVIFTASASGYRNYALAVSRGPDAELSDMLAPFRSPLRCLFAAAIIVLFLALFAALAVLGAMISVLLFALIAFCALLILYLYRPFWFVLYDRPELSVIGCFRETRKLTAGRRKDLFCFDLVFFWFPFLASLLPYFIFSIPAVFPSVFEGLAYGTQELIALILGEVFSAIIYIWKFDYVSTAYACFYNEMV